MQQWVDITTIDNNTPFMKVRWKSLFSSVGDSWFAESPGIVSDNMSWTDGTKDYGWFSAHRLNSDNYYCCSFDFDRSKPGYWDESGQTYRVTLKDAFRNQYYDTTVQISGETYYEVDFNLWSGASGYQLYAPYSVMPWAPGDIYVYAGSSDIRVDKEKVSYKSTGGTTTLTVTAENDWTATQDANWFTVSSLSGTSGTTSITVTAPDYQDTTSARTGTITFSCNTDTVEVTVKQAKKASGEFGGLYFGGLELENMYLADEALEGLYLGDLPIFEATPKPKYYIEYTASSKQYAVINKSYWKANLVSHYFDDVTGKGTIIFDGPYEIPYGTRSFANKDFTSVNINGCTAITRISGSYGAFYGCTNLTDVWIDNACKSIADATFNNATNITAITIGSGIETLGNNVTVNSSNLATITIKATTPPNCIRNPFQGSASAGTLYVPAASVPAYEAWIDTMGDISEWVVCPIGGQPENFVDCKITTNVDGDAKTIAYNISSLSTVSRIDVDGVTIYPNTGWEDVYWVFPQAGVHTVRYVFPTDTASSIAQATDIEEYNASRNIKGIANYAISACGHLTDIKLPKVTYIGNNALRYDSALTALTMPKLESVGNNAFRGVGLEEVNFGPALSSCGYNLFNGSTSLSALTFDASTTGLTYFQSVGDNTSALVEVVFPDCIQTYCQDSMQYGLFYGSSSLSAVTFGSGATTFQGLAFGGNMPALTSITCKAPIAPSIVSGCFSGVTSNVGTLYVPQGSDYSTWAAELGSNWTVSDTL